MRIADIAECSGDALARAVRFRLRKDHGITSGFDVVLSLEKPRCKLVDAGEAGSNPLDYQVWAHPRWHRVLSCDQVKAAPGVGNLLSIRHI